MVFALQKREEITKTNTNNSTSKMLWSFSKSKRFATQKTECPYVSYQLRSTLSKKRYLFPKSKRKVFSQVSKNPSSWVYNPKLQQHNKVYSSFGLTRQKCVSNSYIAIQNTKTPGPGTYQQKEQNKAQGYSLRPKTAYQRLYFIDNKEQKDTPAPSKYQVSTDRNGVSMNSKFKTVCLGPYGPKYKNQRFKTSYQQFPGPNVYKPKRSAILEYSMGGKIGFEQRKSFIDRIVNKSQGPGPGNYKTPSQFGHYAGIQIESKQSFS